MQLRAPLPISIADRDAELWHDGPLIKYAYWFDISKFPIGSEGPYKCEPAVFERFREKVFQGQGKKPSALPIGRTFGDLGEHFAAITFGITLHKDSTAEGSDGRLGDELVEVKTITPFKKTDRVQIKRAGDFTKIVVVKITKDFQFGARMVNRSILKEGSGKWALLFWDQMIKGCGTKALEMHRSFPIVKNPER